MATGDIIPDTDVAVAWQLTGAATHEGAIDEAKAAPSTADFIYGTNVGGDDNAVDTFDNSTIAGIAEATQAQVYIYCARNATGGQIDIDFSHDGTNWEGYKTTQPDQIAPNYGWRNKTFAGLNMTQAELNACRVRFRCELSVPKTNVYIATCYIVITYTAAAGAWGHIMSGVAGASIGNVSGVAIANIADIKGVDI